MCSIIGSFDRNMYDVLFNANKERGTFAYSHCLFNNKNTAPFHIKKFSKLPDINKIADVASNVYHFGHFQAPTSSVRVWKEETSHPFEDNDWIVAHNGVISNFEELKQEYAPAQDIKVDSSLIPIMLHFHTFKHEKSDKEGNAMMIEKAIKVVLEKIKGTFAVWIINRAQNRAFIARQGSTLFANTKTGSFSSVECKSAGWMQIPEGCIYEVMFKTRCLTLLGKFNNNSPFLFIPE